MPVIAASWKPRSPNSAAAASISRRSVLRPRSVRGSFSLLPVAGPLRVAISPFRGREVEPDFSFAQAGRASVDLGAGPAAGAAQRDEALVEQPPAAVARNP